MSSAILPCVLINQLLVFLDFSHSFKVIFSNKISWLQNADKISILPIHIKNRALLKLVLELESYLLRSIIFFLNLLLLGVIKFVLLGDHILQNQFRFFARLSFLRKPLLQMSITFLFFFILYCLLGNSLLSLECQFDLLCKV